MKNVKYEAFFASYISMTFKLRYIACFLYQSLNLDIIA
jgi:hypothetical protein